MKLPPDGLPAAVFDRELYIYSLICTLQESKADRDICSAYSCALREALPNEKKYFY